MDNDDGSSYVAAVAEEGNVMFWWASTRATDVAKEAHAMQGEKKLCRPKQIVGSIKIYRHHVKYIF